MELAANENEKRLRPQPIAKAVRASLPQTVADGTVLNARELIFAWLGEQVPVT